jgi:hypothetical protein
MLKSHNGVKINVTKAEDLMATKLQPTLNKIEARQGETGGHMRMVLAFSTGLAIVLLGGVYLWFMVIQGH